MPIDPALDVLAGAEGDPTVRLAQRVADLAKRLSALESGGRRVYVGPGAPALSVPDGALYVETTTPRLYVRAGGAWRYAGLA